MRLTMITATMLVAGLLVGGFLPSAAAAGHTCVDTGQNSYDCVKNSGGCVYVWTDDDSNSNHNDSKAHTEAVSCPTSELGPILETTRGLVA